MFKQMLALSALVVFSACAQTIPAFTISTIAGDGISGFSGDGGPATNAMFRGPFGVVPDAAGNIYIADFNNQRVRKIATDGTIITIAGTGVQGFGGDGGPATQAMLSRPSRISIDTQGNLFLTDPGNNRVRKIAPTGIITTVAGNGNAAETGDGGLATNAALNYPQSAVADTAGNLYIADGNSNVVRKVDPKGIISTVAGNAAQGYSGDGGAATKASLSDPVGVAVAPNGDLFIADQNNNRIRKVSNGIISTVAGNGVQGFGGDGGQAISAKLSSPSGPFLDAAGNLYFADAGNNRIRVLLTNGNITTIAGSGPAAFGGDGSPALNSELNMPLALAVAPSGAVYVADSFNQRVRLLTPIPQTTGTVSGASFQTGIVPNCWITIIGFGLSPVVDTWDNSIVNGILPTSLDGVSVSVGGQPAYVYYISPTQINAIAPNIAPGPAQVTVTVGGSVTAPVSAIVEAFQPAFFQWGTYAVATRLDFSLATRNGTLSVPTTPAKPGDVIILWGTGFGATSPPAPVGALVPTITTYYTATPVTVTVGGLPAVVYGAALASGYAGLYQVAIQIPPSLQNGDYPVVATIDGVPSPSTTLITVQQ